MGLVFNGTSGTDKISAVDGTLTIDGVATINSITSPIITGDLSISDTIVHTGDTNTKIRFPSADTFTVETAGSERIRIDSSGKMGIGTNNPNNPLTIHASGNHIFLKDTATNNVLQIRHASGVAEFNSYDLDGNARRDYVFNQYSTEVLRITSTGALLLGATSTSNVENFRIHTANSNKAIIKFTNSGTGTASSDGFEMGLNGNEHVEFWHKENHPMYFATNNVERLRIDSSGRILQGSSAGRNTALMAAQPTYQLEGVGSNASNFGIFCNSNASAAGGLIFGKTRGSSVGGTTVVAANDSLGHISFEGSDGSAQRVGARITAAVDGTPGSSDMPGRLMFFTTPDGSATEAERLRIDKNGDMCLGGTPFSQGTGNTFCIHSSGTGGGDHAYIYFTNGDSGHTASDGMSIGLAANQVANISVREAWPLAFSVNGSERLRIASNGAMGLSGANYGSSGQVLTSQGSGSAPQWATAASGGWTIHKDAVTAFGNASIEQTSGLSSSTDVIQIIAYRLRCGNGSGTEISVQLGTSGGYGGTYNGMQRYFNSSGSQETHQDHDQSMWAAWHGQGNPFSQTNMEFSGTLTITRMGGNNFVMESQCLSEKTDNNTQYLLINAGRLELGGALTKLKVYTQSGNNFSHGNLTIRSM